ncbi:MAG: anthranilate phosphoribosyltransferase [Candidatus Omnitrophica bacterium]|nr:anthranilate phosphoribosyltransferase [Candidatus Omnitrophota bacterium]
MLEIIQKLNKYENLSPDEIQAAFRLIMNGTAGEANVKAFLLALRAKGATVEEITGAATVMRQFALPVASHQPVILDTCGTGGDRCHTFNISTLSAFVIAGVGVAVAKHGNRSASSRCGSADVLEALGVSLLVEEKNAGLCLDDVGIVFLFAPAFHPAMKNVATIRKQIGHDTIFNLLGPLTNPAEATHQIVGVYHRDLVAPVATVLKNLGLQRAMVVHGNDGLDEITTTEQTFISEFNGADIVSYDITPEELGFKRAKPLDLTGGDLKENIRIFESVLDGERGPKRDIVVINAAYGLYLCGRAKTVAEGVELAKESLDTGKARQKLETLKEFSRRIEEVNRGRKA